VHIFCAVDMQFSLQTDASVGNDSLDVNVSHWLID